jgi:UDP-N-acetylmuramoylalanine--D-glutamate ligase
VWSEVELAWHLRPEEDAAAWITVSGTNGKTTTLTMLTEILSASGADAGAAGNIGTPLVEAVLHQPAYDVLAVELSSFQLHFTASLRPLASCLLNVAPDHLDWHASWQDYLADKARVFTGTEAVMALDVTDPLVSRLANQARVSAGCRKVGYQASPPDTGMVGLIDGIIVDRAFADEPTELCDVAALPMSGTHNITNALAASTLARAYGVGADAVRRGLGSSSGQPHRLVTVTEIRGVRYVDDSKATNPHAARASILTFDHVVWIAGGLAKGADFDELVQEVQPRLTVAVLIGRDRAQIREALARHAPQVAVVEVAATDTGGMETAVHEAAQRARRGDTVLLAPACASMDLFADYAARGDAFVAAVGRLAG